MLELWTLESSCNLPVLLVSIEQLVFARLFFNHCRTAKAELERVSAEESAAREERNKFERSLTMVQHDMKEVQRKLELEMEQRQKVVAQRNEFENQLQTQVSARQAALDNSQQFMEKIQHLDKQVLRYF